MEGVIEIWEDKPALTSQVPPIFFNDEKGGSLRLCLKHSEKTAAILRDIYPISLMNGIIGSSGKATIFSKLEAHRGC